MKTNAVRTSNQKVLVHAIARAVSALVFCLLLQVGATESFAGSIQSGAGATRLWNRAPSTEKRKRQITIRRLRPSWTSERSRFLPTANESYISNYSARGRSGAARTLDDFFDDTIAVNEMRYQYERYVADYERTQAHDLTTLETERACVDRNLELRREFVKGLSGRELNDRRRTMRRNAVNATSKSARKPIEVVGTLAAVYLGEPMALNLGVNTRLNAQTDFRERKGQFKFSSPTVNSDFYFADDANRTDLSKPQEKYSLSLYRPLPILGLSSGLSYGSSSSLVTASLARQIAPNLTCTVASSYGTTPDSVAREQESVRLSYELRF